MRYLVTGTAGFIGFHVARRLLAEGHVVAGVDGMTPYYDVKLKDSRVAILAAQRNFTNHVLMLEDAARLDKVADDFKPECVIHLAAQAGVRYSIENPRAYIDSNIVGTFNVIEVCRRHAVQHAMIASTSSVYGANDKLPFHETDRTDHPLTIYAATKKSTEVIAHCYSHLWGIPITTFRFFSVYGPWGRPDMALFKFVQNIIAGQPIDIYNHGKMKRDFTYIDDLVEAIVRLAKKPPVIGESAGPEDSLSSVGPFRIVNIGGGTPVELIAFVEEIEAALGKPAIRNLMEMQTGDVPTNEASAALLERLIGYRPTTPVRVGIAAFIAWYRDYYKV